jgi:hypothetical protein
MRHAHPTRTPPAAASTAALACAAAAAFGAWSGNLDARERPVESTPPAGAISSATSIADLERAYWTCDHAATTTALDIGSASLCSTVSEALLKTRFHGNFEAMLSWWRENKTAQHLALDAAQRARAGRGLAGGSGR